MVSCLECRWWCSMTNYKVLVPSNLHWGRQSNIYWAFLLILHTQSSTIGMLISTYCVIIKFNSRIEMNSSLWDNNMHHFIIFLLGFKSLDLRRAGVTQFSVYSKQCISSLIFLRRLIPAPWRSSSEQFQWSSMLSSSPHMDTLPKLMFWGTLILAARCNAQTTRRFKFKLHFS